MERIQASDRCIIEKQCYMEKQQYSVLVIGYNCYPGHLADFIRNLKKENPIVKVTLLTRRPIERFPEDIKKNASQIVKVKAYKGLGKNGAIGNLINIFFLLKVVIKMSRNRFDIVNIHFPTPEVGSIMTWVKRMTDNIVITPWGSDVLRVEDKRAIRRLKRVYNAAISVMVDPESQMGEQVVSKFGFDSAKILPISWGIEYVDYISENKPQMTVEESKRRFAINDRYVITCGYNCRLSQRHEVIIEAISKIKDKLPKNLTLLFPFTYGVLPRATYKKEVLEMCDRYGLNAVIVRDFLGYEDLYMLRNATDMFVHIQTTDAASSCVMQYILCNKKIVHGSWMKYYDLEQYEPLFYFPVDCIDDLADVILSAYQSDPIRIPQGVIDTIMSKGWKDKMSELNAYWESELGNNLAQ